MEKLLPSVIERCLCGVITEARLEKGLAQKEIAQRLGVHPPFITKIEQGDRHILAVELLEISEAYGLGVEELMRRWQRALKRAADGGRKGPHAA